jgi:transcription elongation factor Elf1
MRSAVPKQSKPCVVHIAHVLTVDVNYSCSDLTEPIDIYSEWIDAADAAQQEEHVLRRPTASSSRPIPALPSVDSDDDD